MTVSVVIASHLRAEQVETCLNALAAQTHPPLEVILVDSGADQTTARLVASQHPEVRLIRSVERLGPHEARNRGAAVAGGEVIAFTDADCRADPGWVEALLAAHRGGAELVGGSIDPDHGSLIDQAANLSKFNPWLQGLGAGRRVTYPTANLSLSRAAWERFGPFAIAGWSGDTELVWRARAGGAIEAFAPSAVVAHIDSTDLAGLLAERRRRGRAFARLRAEREEFSRLRATAYLLAAPLIGALLSARAIGATVRSGRAAAALRTAPLLVLAFYAWALGEASAYLGVAARRSSSLAGR